MMLRQKLTEKIRKSIVGINQEFIFREANNIDLPFLKKIDFYIHIPFCKNMCPYCPYNKIKYDEKLVKPFRTAILKEIELYHKKLGEIEIPSIYIGGGTPTNLIDVIGEILDKLDENFNITGDIAIETSPNDITIEIVEKLKNYNVDLISLGVQSFNDKYLRFIGRKYTSDILAPAIDLIKKFEFETLNIDLMFALPGQTISEVISDIKRAMDLGADQITLYPLFTFPYTVAGNFLKIKKVKMPHILNRRVMYKKIHDFCIDNGYNRVSVWGFKKNASPRYSSVTRDQYIGVGPGAGTYVSNGFYFNTFSVKEYIKTCKNEKIPISLKMEVNRTLAKYYWLYWRLYDTYIDKQQLENIFENDNKIQKYFRFAKYLKLYTEDNEHIFLTERGAFWIHLLQNYFVLNYIDKVWSVSMKDPWPKMIRI